MLQPTVSTYPFHALALGLSMLNCQEILPILFRKVAIPLKAQLELMQHITHKCVSPLHLIIYDMSSFHHTLMQLANAQQKTQLLQHMIGECVRLEVAANRLLRSRGVRGLLAGPNSHFCCHNTPSPSSS